MKNALIIGAQPLFRYAIAEMLKEQRVGAVTECESFEDLSPKASLLAACSHFNLVVICIHQDHGVLDMMLKSSRLGRGRVVVFSELMGKRHKQLMSQGKVDLCLPMSVPCSVAQAYLSRIIAPNEVARGHLPMRLDRSVDALFMPDLADLSHSEQVVLSHLREGLSNRDIAERMNLQPNTIKVYLYRACRKAGFMNRTQAARTTNDLINYGLLDTTTEPVIQFGT